MNDDFHAFDLGTFSNIKFLLAICQCFKCVLSDDLVEASILRHIIKSMSTRASQCNRAYILNYKKAYVNFFVCYP